MVCYDQIPLFESLGRFSFLELLERFHDFILKGIIYLCGRIGVHNVRMQEVWVNRAKVDFLEKTLSALKQISELCVL